jgi:hypothetical protein
MTLGSLCQAQTIAESCATTSSKQDTLIQIQNQAPDLVEQANATLSTQVDPTPLKPSNSQQAESDELLLPDTFLFDANLPKKQAMTAALADGVTTGLALSMGAVETNPVLGSAPISMIAATGVKFAILKYADSMPLEQKRFTLKASSSVWGGAAINNILVLLAAPPPTALIAGLVMGFLTWKQMDNHFEEEDKIVALQQNKLRPTEKEAIASTVNENENESSGQ